MPRSPSLPPRLEKLYGLGPFDPARIYLIVYSVISTLGWSYVLVLIFVHLLNLDSTSDTIATRANTDQLGLSFTSNRVVRASLRAFPPILPPFVLEKKATLSRLLSASKAFKLALKVYPGLSDNHHQSRSPSYLYIIYRRTTTTFLRFGFTITIVQSFTIFEVAYLLQQGLAESMKTTMWYLIPRSFLLQAHYFFKTLGSFSETLLIYSTLPRLQDTWSYTDFLRGILCLMWWPGINATYNYIMSQRHEASGKLSCKLKSD
ncbi:hypothetical protein HYPSUDRAFT_55084 [Hypholoma sublateritium FD-334 SS-4]|uniref:Very-long-chain (3R)-3-hydroxyacyl-CoA dehydratase n=1 Tax=Hypholoma sublateritium (strain FD-334 SS-4) TaxID=945553 RepID=A0A0D2MF67_HYPSF|nr:hypothetical protein HYPSUDRAFT_55084 [Hypholoma sublateritium FD-334 SS-4]